MHVPKPWSARITRHPLYGTLNRERPFNVVCALPRPPGARRHVWRRSKHCLTTTTSVPGATQQSTDQTIASVSRIQVKHQTHIPISKEQVLEICKDMCEEKWSAVRPVLSGIECIHRFECQLEGERALNTFELANKVEHVTGKLQSGEMLQKDLELALEASVDETKFVRERAFPQIVHGMLPFIGKRKESFTDFEAEIQEREQAVHYHKINQKARTADWAFVQCLKRLLSLAHYDPLDVRDVALSRSLNADYLSQIFIKADVSKMDADFVTGEVSEDLPAEVRPMLTFKRGYGEKTEFRRLFLPMMDYLQLLVVKSAFSTLKDAVVHVWMAFANLFKLIWKRLGLRDDSDENVADQLGSLYVAEGLMSKQLRIDKKSWKKMKRVGKDVIVSMNEWGISPKVMAMGGGTLVTLADWGYIPRLDALPIETFDSVWPVKEGDDPVHLHRVALPNTIGHVLKDGPPGLFKKVELQEPTFEHLVVVYRYQDKESPINQIKQRIRGPNAPRIEERKDIQIRIYSKIPIPIWKAVIPAKLLQFRPLDGLRLDLITIVGIASLAAHARFTSVLFDIVTLTTLIVYGIRVIMGYKKMYDRYENFLNDLLRRRTIAGQEGALAYLANSAYLQQFKQCALAYVLLVSSDRAMRKDEISAQLNEKLRRLEEKTSFDVDDALTHLRRLGLVRLSFLAGYGETFIAGTPAQALRSIKTHWSGLLDASVQSTATEDKKHFPHYDTLL